VKISYKSKKLKKQLTEPKTINKTFGTMAKKVNARMKDLKASDNLAVLMKIPAARCHSLKGEKKEQFAVDISKNYRLIFEPDHHPVPRKADGGLDYIKIVDIIITATEDYH
jgi:proteic killer suppression protein